jgi:hypothetical protein
MQDREEEVPYHAAFETCTIARPLLIVDYFQTPALQQIGVWVLLGPASDVDGVANHVLLRQGAAARSWG